MNKLIIELEGGLVQNKYSNSNEYLEVIVADLDTEGIPDDEITLKKELDKQYNLKDFKIIPIINHICNERLF